MHWYCVEYEVLGQRGLNEFECQAYDVPDAKVQFETWAKKVFGSIATIINRVIFIDDIGDIDWFSHEVHEDEYDAIAEQDEDEYDD